MTEAAHASEHPLLPIRLEVRASDSMKELVGNLMKDELQTAFARSAFLTLILRPGMPVTLPLADSRTTNRLTPEAMLLRRSYRQSVEDIESKDQIFLKQLHIAPIFGYRHIDSRGATGILFQLQLSEPEKNRLLQPPFDTVDRQTVAVGQVFKDEVMKAGDEFDEAVGFVREKLRDGAYIDRRTGQRRAADRYYVTRPTLKP